MPGEPREHRAEHEARDLDPRRRDARGLRRGQKPPVARYPVAEIRPDNISDDQHGNGDEPQEGRPDQPAGPNECDGEKPCSGIGVEVEPGGKPPEMTTVRDRAMKSMPSVDDEAGDGEADGEEPVDEPDPRDADRDARPEGAREGQRRQPSRPPWSSASAQRPNPPKGRTRRRSSTASRRWRSAPSRAEGPGRRAGCSTFRKEPARQHLEQGDERHRAGSQR